MSTTKMTHCCFHAEHTGIFKSVLNMRHGLENLEWRTTEYDRYKNLFMKQSTTFIEEEKEAKKGTRAWRFFGDLQCVIRIGKNYLMNVPETLHNTFETISLQQVQSNIAKLEESVGFHELQSKNAGSARLRR